MSRFVQNIEPKDQSDERQGKGHERKDEDLYEQRARLKRWVDALQERIRSFPYGGDYRTKIDQDLISSIRRCERWYRCLLAEIDLKIAIAEGALPAQLERLVRRVELERCRSWLISSIESLELRGHTPLLKGYLPRLPHYQSELIAVETKIANLDTSVIG